MEIRTVTAMRYVTPLREGGSLPAIVEADDEALYVLKFVGAGQGPRALIAELLAGEIGRHLGLHVPELVFVTLDPAFGNTEMDPEIAELIQASRGLNLGLRYLPYSFAYDPLLRAKPSAELASAIVWFDAYVTNVDRTLRNTNILVWQRELWLIDHGAALYFHHDWRDYLERSRSPFAHIKDHVLLPYAGALDAADAAGHARLDNGIIGEIAGLLPGEWLADAVFANPAEYRSAYAGYLRNRLAASAVFVEEAKHARSLRI